MLADPSRANYTSAKEGSRQFATQSLVPWVSKLQRAFAQSILAPEAGWPASTDPTADAIEPPVPTDTDMVVDLDRRRG